MRVGEGKLERLESRECWGGKVRMLAKENCRRMGL